jgi:hypothetical protein
MSRYATLLLGGLLVFINPQMLTSYPIYVITIPKLYYLILGKIITSPSYIYLMTIPNKKLTHIITLPIYPIIRIHVQDIPIYNIL